MSTFTALSLILPTAIFSHVTEEFLYPGGFIEWYKQFRPALADGIKPGYIVWINSLMIGVFALKKYSPGVVTGVLFYIPLFVYGRWYLLSSNSLSYPAASSRIRIDTT